MPNSIYLDPKTHGYDLINNKFVYQDSLVSKVNVQLAKKIGTDINDINGGNPMLNDDFIINQSNVTKALNFALNPLISSGFMKSFSINNITIDYLGRWSVSINVVSNSGSTIPILYITPLGGK